jgi:hypothetical protein
VIWPFDQATRFMLPMLPVLWVSAAEAIAAYRWRAKLLTTLTAAHLLVSLFYWIHSTWDSPHASDWESLAVLSRPVVSSGEPAAAWNLEDYCADMLRLHVDRSLPLCRCEEELAADIRWLVGPAESRPPDGFAQHATSGPFALWERTARCR